MQHTEQEVCRSKKIGNIKLNPVNKKPGLKKDAEESPSAEN